MVGDDYSVTSYGFTQVLAFSRNGSDTANLLDTPGDDEVRFRSHKTQMYDMDTDGEEYRLTVRSFEKVHADATQGGYDKAKLHDAANDDLFEASGNTARMTTIRSRPRTPLRSCRLRIRQSLSIGRQRSNGRSRPGRFRSLLRRRLGIGHLAATY